MLRLPWLCTSLFLHQIEISGHTCRQRLAVKNKMSKEYVEMANSTSCHTMLLCEIEPVEVL